MRPRRSTDHVGFLMIHSYVSRFLPLSQCFSTKSSIWINESIESMNQLLVFCCCSSAEIILQNLTLWSIMKSMDIVRSVFSSNYVHLPPEPILPWVSVLTVTTWRTIEDTLLWSPHLRNEWSYHGCSSLRSHKHESDGANMSSIVLEINVQKNPEQLCSFDFGKIKCGMQNYRIFPSRICL